MTDTEAVLRNPQTFRSILRSATLSQLQAVQANLNELIDECRVQNEQRQLERKGKRVLADMRSLMAKAGISMEELQSVLPK